MILVSACLAGIRCAWDGKSRPNNMIIELVKQGKAMPVCPEQLGGLSTPRDPAERLDDKIIIKSGQDVTKAYYSGAVDVLEIAKMENIKKAIMKSKSPSCGVGQIYDGTFSNKLISGDGICVELLKKNGIKVISEKEI
jgi:uncharacterized protein YbbK (DUF523 family)